MLSYPACPKRRLPAMNFSFSAVLLAGFVFCEMGLLVSSSAVAISPQHSRKDFWTLRGGSAISKKLFQKPTCKMASLFTDEEAVYDTYAACLAATEGLRRIRDQDMAQQKRSDAKRRVAAQYVESSREVVNSLGMMVEDFNEIGRLLAQNEELKQKVVEQAYLYRMAATVTMDRSPLLCDDSTSLALEGISEDTLRGFCKSVTEVETLRETQVEKLKRQLHIDQFPPSVNISDPALLPFLNPKVRAFVEGFPVQAEEIVKGHGLETDEFNKLLDAANRSPSFRRKVQHQMKMDG